MWRTPKLYYKVTKEHIIGKMVCLVYNSKYKNEQAVQAIGNTLVRYFRWKWNMYKDEEEYMYWDNNQLPGSSTKSKQVCT